MIWQTDNNSLQLPTCCCRSMARWSWLTLAWLVSWRTRRSRGRRLWGHRSGWPPKSFSSLPTTPRWDASNWTTACKFRQWVWLHGPQAIGLNVDPIEIVSWKHPIELALSKLKSRWDQRWFHGGFSWFIIRVHVNGTELLPTHSFLCSPPHCM